MLMMRFWHTAVRVLTEFPANNWCCELEIRKEGQTPITAAFYGNRDTYLNLRQLPHAPTWKFYFEDDDKLAARENNGDVDEEIRRLTAEEERLKNI